MTAPLPDPLVPLDVDLRGYEFIPLFGDRLFGSETWIGITPEAKLAALQLWWRAYAKEVPASSLPENDALLANYAGYGVQMKPWRRVKAQAMRGFVLCSDGRWYHPFVAELALDAWKGRRQHQLRTMKARVAALEKRLAAATTDDDHTHISGLLRGLRQELSDAMRESVTEVSDRPSNTVPKERTGRGEGQGQGQDKEKNEKRAPGRSTDPPEPATESARAPSSPDEKPEVRESSLRGALSKALRDEGVTNVTPSVPTIVDWVKRGVTVQLAREAVDLARDKKPKPQQVPLAYLEPIVEQLLNPKPRVNGAQRAAPSLDWWTSPAGIFAKAESEGIEIAMRNTGDGDVRDHLVTLARLCAKLGEGSWFDRRNTTLVRIVDEIRARESERTA